MTATVEVQLTPGVWAAIEPDVSGMSAFSTKRGIPGNGPLDLVSGTGELQFALRNDAQNSALIQGYYSPGHASRRAGWTFGIPIRVTFTSGAVTEVVFRGKIRVIAPDPGQYGQQRVTVTAYDAIRDLAEADVREVAVQVNKTESELLTAILAAIPVDAQPPATDLDTGLDTYPYAFDDIGSGAKALSLARDVVVSAFGILFASADGTLTYRTRHASATETSEYAFDDDDIDGLDVPSSLDSVYNRVRVTIHPRTLSAAATEELYVLPTETTIEIPTGDTREVWTDYSDPNDRQSKVGGTGVVTALVGGTHYSANSSADGSGTDLTASITASLSAFGSTGKWTITNTGASTAYVRVLKVIGKAVRDPGPQTLESYVAGSYGDRPLAVDLPYQDDQQIGQSAADFVRVQYGALTQQVTGVSFLASASAALMAQALQRDIGDHVTITERVTGLADVECVIRSVSLELTRGGVLRCQWGLAPASPFAMWLLGESSLGEGTMLGF